MLTTRAPGQRRHVDQAAVALDLQPADVVLVDERQEAGVAVGADALAVRRRRARPSAGVR